MPLARFCTFIPMIKSAHEIVIYVHLFSDIVLIFVSLAFCYRDFNPKYLRTFPLFCIIEFCADTILNLYLADEPIRTTINNLLTLVELTYLCYFLTRLIQSRISKRIIWGLVILFCVLFFKQLSRHGIIKGYLEYEVAESLILIIPCMAFLKEVFTSQFKIDLAREPSFWIVTGVLFYFTFSIPFVLCRAYFAMKGELTVDFQMINSFSVIVSNILYIKGCTCRIKK